MPINQINQKRNKKISCEIHSLFSLFIFSFFKKPLFSENRTKRNHHTLVFRVLHLPVSPLETFFQKSSSSPQHISIGQLHALLRFHLRPIYLLVWKGSYQLKAVGYLILRCASRLDAFSVYHIHTQLPSCALGRTTGAPEVCPSRSSRTKDSSSQISFAHDR